MSDHFDRKTQWVRSFVAGAVLVFLFADSIAAEALFCGRSEVLVEAAESGHAKMVCRAVSQAELAFDQCALPAFKSGLKIVVVSEMEPDCAAYFHAEKETIVALEPTLMAAGRGDKSPFGFLSEESYFRSVIVHELAHSVAALAPCRDEPCIIAGEYFAYAMQVMSLPPEARVAFADRAGLNRPITLQELNRLVLYMAPGRFAQKVWTHLMQNDDPCEYLRHILDGTVQLDYERFSGLNRPVGCTALH